MDRADPERYRQLVTMPFEPYEGRVGVPRLLDCCVRKS
jgi:hypothetical protein